MTPDTTIQAEKNLPAIQADRRRVRLRTQRASREWVGLGVDLEHSLDAIANARRSDVAQLHPAHNERQALDLFRETVIQIFASRASKLEDLRTLVRLAALVSGCHDPAWVRVGDDAISNADAAFYSLYAHTIRLTRPA